MGHPAGYAGRRTLCLGNPYERPRNEEARLYTQIRAQLQARERARVRI